MPKPLDFGLAQNFSWGEGGYPQVIGRNTTDPARWKRYRGGKTGALWVKKAENEKFLPLLNKIDGNITNPMILGQSIFFISDHEGYGNLYSCNFAGENLKRLTQHENFFVRNSQSDGQSVIYQCGGDLYLYEPLKNISEKIVFQFNSPKKFLKKRFVGLLDYLEDFDLNSKGDSILFACRGKVFAKDLWENPLDEIGFSSESSRKRLACYLGDSGKAIFLEDDRGEEIFKVIDLESGEIDVLNLNDFGRPLSLKSSAKGDYVIFDNHKYELLLLDIKNKKIKKIAQSNYDRILGFDISACGTWISYSLYSHHFISQIYLYNLENDQSQPVTAPLKMDFDPSFDPEGRFLYFLSSRDFNPIEDQVQFGYSFPFSIKPYLIPLKADFGSPFGPEKRIPGKSLVELWKEREEEKKKSEEKEDSKTEEKQTQKESGADSNTEKEEDEKKEEEVSPLEIDLTGISVRVLDFPVEDDLYSSICGAKYGKVFWTIEKLKAESGQTEESGDQLECFDFDAMEAETWENDVEEYKFSGDGEVLIYKTQGDKLRVLESCKKPDEEESKPGRKSGWLSYDELSFKIDLRSEWKQMYREAWRLQRDHFWQEDMAGIDWEMVYQKYFPLLDRIGSRSDLSDLLWEMQGELGTSHCYEFGGDYPHSKTLGIGLLGADFRWNKEQDGYEITRILKGDSWSDGCSSAFSNIKQQIQCGDIIRAIDSNKLSEELSPQEALLNRAGQEVFLRVLNPKLEEEKRFSLKCLNSEKLLRYRDWVEAKRLEVEKKSQGRFGYIHIPDMGTRGFGEFFRSYLKEYDKDALIIDLRFNGGGNVSQLILEKLVRQRIGFDAQRHGEPAPYPMDAPKGPMVAIINEHAGSDGDVFSHSFKLYGLGPLVGKRTWGGVVGIWPRHSLIDGTLTTQPEFSSWFKDVGFGVENYGVDPDYEVDELPEDKSQEIDRQLEKAMEVALLEIENNKVLKPDFEKVNLRPPRLS